LGGTAKAGSFRSKDFLPEEYKMDNSKNEGHRDGLKTILDDSTKLSLDSVAKATIRKKIESKKIVLDTLPEAR
jgi:hypothetical protein